MRVATFEGERDLTNLVNRLYQLPEPSRLVHPSARETEALVKKAADALRRANPALNELNKLPRGTVLVVPEIEGLKHTANVHTMRTAMEDTLAGVRETVANSQKGLQASLEDRIKDLRSLLKQFETKEVQPLKDHKAFATAAEETQKQTESITQVLRKLGALQEKVLDQLDKDLTALSKLASSSGH